MVVLNKSSHTVCSNNKKPSQWVWKLRLRAGKEGGIKICFHPQIYLAEVVSFLSHYYCVFSLINLSLDYS